MRVKLPKDDDTIVAIATPPGEGGIGILRLSGPQAPAALVRLWRGRASVPDFQSHHLYLGDLIEPATGEVLERALVVWMKAPRSYTGQEVIEIHAHGGPLLLNRLQEVLVQAGLRVAEPGEFTRRAYLHGKMDLLQAEAVGAMIHANSEAALRHARGQLAGRVSQEVGAVRAELIDLLARLEAAIDFPEEDIEILQPRQTQAAIASLQGQLKRWLEKFQLGRLLREGVRVALVGRPNVGKSSLLNRLLQEDKAIVHHEPGTTRDVVEGWLELEGVAFQLFDTAGIRQGSEAVEQAGIVRSRRVMENSDLILWVVNVSEPLTEEDRAIVTGFSEHPPPTPNPLSSADETIRAAGGPRPATLLVVGNKADLPVVAQRLPADWPLPAGLVGREWLLVSARSGERIEGLKRALVEAAGVRALSDQSHSYLNNARHREAIQGAHTALTRAASALTGALPPECVAADLREALAQLEALLGEVSHEEILDKVFAEFCLGK
jgi:tRNA modification GTPase